MVVSLGAEDIQSIDIKHGKKDETTYGYAVVYLRKHIPEVSVFHFNFSMTNDDFIEQITTLEAAGHRSGFDVNLTRKSRFSLAVEKLLVGALAGTAYQSRGCPSCRMIDTFIAGGRSIA